MKEPLHQLESGDIQQQGHQTESIFRYGNFHNSAMSTPLGIDYLNSSPLEKISEKQHKFEQQTLRFSCATRTAWNEQELELNTLLVGAWAVVLSRYSCESNVVFGLSLSEKSSIVLELVDDKTLDYVLPVGIKVPIGGASSTWLTKLQLQIAEFIEFSSNSIKEKQAKNSLQSNDLPLFESVLDLQYLQYASVDALLLETLSLKQLQLSEQLGIPLRITVYPEKEFVLQVTYNGSRFDFSTITRLLENLATLIENMIDAEDRASNLPWITATERHKILTQWNQTYTEYPRDLCIHQIFEMQAIRSPDAVAVAYAEQQLTYRQLNHRANQLSHYLRQLGVQSETLVGIYLEQSIDAVVGLLGVLKAGGVYLPLDPTYPQERLDSVLEDSETPVIVTQQSLYEKLPPSDAKLVCIDLELENISQQNTENPRTDIDSNNLAYVIYTSGSTGRPKGVAVTHQGISRLVLNTNYIQITSDEHIAQVSNISFDAATFEIWGALLNGAKLCGISKDILLSPQKFISELLQKRISVLFLTTALFNQIAREVPEAFNSLRYLLFGGEAVDPKWVNAVLRAGPPQNLLHVYGPTENTTFSSWYLVKSVSENAKTIPIGKPIANTQAYVLDRQRNPVPIGVPGELYLGGDGLAREYLKRPEITQSVFIDLPNWPKEETDVSSNSTIRLYKTGDIVRYLPDGNLVFLRRADYQVKIRGFRIELEEVRSAIRRHPDVQDVVVIDREDVPGDKRLVAYLVCDCSVIRLREFLIEKLPGYMIPAAFVKMDALPLTLNGKVDRRVLPIPERTRPDLETAFIPPQTEVEAKLVEIWAKVLDLDCISTQDNFFDLGGHSLLATQILLEVGKTFEVDLPVSILLDLPTVASLAKKIEHLPIQEVGVQKLISSFPTITANVADRYEPFPLNGMQQAYWIGRNSFFELGNIAIHLYFEVESIDFDVARFNQAWQRLVERHDMLRAVVLPDGRQQILQETPTWQLEVIDLRGYEPKALEEQLNISREHLSHLVKPIEQWPQFEIRALQIDEHATRLYFSFDGWCLDGWSYQILFRDLVTLYQNPKAPLPSVDLSFRDYVLAVQNLETSLAFQHSLEYWQKRIPSLPPAPELPLAINPKTLEKPRFRRYSQQLPSEIWQRLKTRAQKSKLTPTALLMAVYAEVLTLWSKTPHFTINVPRFNRLPLHPQVNEIIGEFASFTLLEIDNSKSDSFEVRAQNLQRQLWQDLEHQYVSGVRVLREIAKFQNVETAGVSFPVVFTTAPQDIRKDVCSVKGTSLGTLGHIVEALSQTPQVHIDNIYFEEADGTLVFNWDFVEDLFPANMIKSMFAAYSQLLMQLAQDESAWQATGRQSLLPTDQLTCRAEVNRTAASIPKVTLQDLFIANLQKHSDNVAIISPECRLTYRQLSTAAYRLGRQLKQSGINANHLVPIIMDKGWEQVVAVLGVLMAGGAYVPIDPEVPLTRLKYLLADSKASIVLTQSHLLSKLQEQTRLPCLCVEYNSVNSESYSTNWISSQQPEDLAYVIYTSGTTGTPKGVMINHLGAVNTILDINNRFAVGSADRVLALSSLSFDLSVYDIFGTLAAGGTIVIPEAKRDKDPAHWLELIEKEGVTLWNSVPALMQILVEYTGQRSAKSLQSLRLALLSGDWLPLTLPKQVKELVDDIELISLGGATEASIWSILYPIHTVEPGWKSIPYGYPMVNQQFHILNQSLEPCPVWVPGQIYIGGIGLAQGYWQNQQKTTKSFIIHPVIGERLYCTGDLGRYLPDGNIEFLGRVDFQLKVRGYRIEPGEIEAALRQHPEIKAAIITVFTDASGEPQLAAYYTLTSDINPNREQLQQWLRERLPHYMVPSVFMYLDTLPLTANGKVNRRQLPEPIIVSSASTKFVAPRTPVEAIIAGI
ncbi:MAG: amino acid adenylation domain-containing protein, partial [Cyanobacteria bacterium J06649_11]